MTAIIGILCKDGVVIGADSSATFAAGNFRTIEQKTNKIEIIDEKIIVANTGHVGFGQRVNDNVINYFRKPSNQKNHIAIGRELSAQIIQDARSTGAPLQNAATIAFEHKGELYLLELEAGTFQPEFKTKNLWYVSMGSGQTITDPFLGFIRRLIWGDEQPNIRGGIFAALWTLMQAIELNAGGINGPPQIAILKKENGKSKANILTDAELEEHKDFISELEAKISSAKNLPDKVDAIPKPNPQRN